MLRWTEMRVGDDIGSLAYEVSEEAIDMFESATDNLGPLWLDGRRIAPPTLGATDYAMLLAARYGPLGSGSHTRQELHSVRPLRADEPVTVSGEVAELYQRRGRDYWLIEYTARAADGEMIAVHRMTSYTDPPRDDPASAQRPSTPNLEPRARPLSEGAVVGRIRRRCDRSSEYAFAAQYRLRLGQRVFDATENPHANQAYARSIGLPDSTGHSMRYVAWCAELLTQTYGAGWLTGGRLDARFLEPVFPGNQLEVLMRVKERDNEGAASQLVFDVVRDGDQLVAVVTADQLPAGVMLAAPDLERTDAA